MKNGEIEFSLADFAVFGNLYIGAFYDNRDRSTEIRGAIARVLSQNLETVTKMSMKWGRGPAECEFL